MTEKEKEILKHMAVLGLTREQAEQLWLEDNSNEVLLEVAEMEQKAKECKRRYEVSDKPRKKATKERKVDENKLAIIQTIISALSLDYSILEVKTETEIRLTDGTDTYTVKLVKHRPAK